MSMKVNPNVGLDGHTFLPNRFYENVFYCISTNPKAHEHQVTQLYKSIKQLKLNQTPLNILKSYE